MTSEIREIFSLLVALIFMIIGMAFMTGGPKLAGKFINWLIAKIWKAIKWLIALPFRLLFPSILGKSGKKKKRRKKSASWL